MSGSCLIMMTSYNSERFLRQQLDSIQSQTYTNWHLIIQDDGSEDSTIEIIREYMEKEPRIELTFNTSGKHGAFPNFHSLINRCKNREAYDYYLFSDHDDIWLSHKIEKMMETCQTHEENGKPVLVYADLTVIDGEGKVTDDSVNRLRNSKCISDSPLSAFFCHLIHGCTELMNRSLFEMVPPVEGGGVRICHDNYYAKFAAIRGEIVFIDEPLILYRRYGGGVSNAEVYTVSFGYLIDRIHKLREVTEWHAYTYSQTLYAIKQLKQIGLSEEEYALVGSIESAICTGGPKAVGFCIKHHIKCGKTVRTIGRYLILLSGAYKKYLMEI